MITFCCVYQVNEKTVYDKNYVYKLYNSLKRNYSKKFNFVCLSNVNLDVDTIRLENNWHGWWSKIELFRPNLFSGKVFYLDLDIIICGNIDKVINDLNKQNFFMIESITPESGNANSSIMSWDGDYSFIYENFKYNTTQIMNKFKKGNLIGDQAYIQSCLNNLNYIKREYIKWNHWKIKDLGEKENAVFYIFCGKDCKPHLNLFDPIVKENWV